jgi:hypothetical protein
MIWLTWRQFRTNAWAALAALAALAVALGLTRPSLVHLYRASGLADCHTDCGQLADSFMRQVHAGSTGVVYWLGGGLVFVVPAVVGVFWGAPLVARELENGTHRLTWNQSVSRTRWLAVKLLGVGLATVLVAGLFSAAVTWWSAQLDSADVGRMLPSVFGARGVVPMGYAAFAFVLGVTAGVLVRRTVPAMAITLAIVVFAQVAMPLWVRPHLMPPVRTSASLDVTNLAGFGIDRDRRMFVMGRVDQPGAWVLSNQTFTPNGQVFTGPADPQACGEQMSPKTCIQWVASLHLKQVVVYQPASRFWAFQWYETGILVGLAVLLAGLCFWWVRRRVT